MQTIVIGWIEEEHYVADLRYVGNGAFSPIMGHRREAKACVWLNEGGSADVEKAQDYVRQNRPDGRVMVFPVECENPLGEARRMLLAAE